MRRRRAPERKVAPDPIYNSELVARFVNNLMWDGKKTLAQKIFYRAMEIVAERTGENPLDVFQKAVENVKPAMEVRSRRIGGANYQIPVEVRSKRQTSLAIKWIIDAARKRPGRRMHEKLAAEIIDAHKGTGNAVKTKENVHRMAEANRVFAHFRW